MRSSISKYLLYYPATLLRGEFVGKYLHSYEQLQWEDSTSIENYQVEKLRRLLSYTERRCPYYASQWKKSGISANDINNINDLRKLPFISKKEVIDEQDRLLSNRLFSTKKTTGGSTGQAITIFKNPDALARERAATWRCYNWAGVSVGDPQARFWGIPITQLNRWQYRLVDFVSNRLVFSAFNFNDESLVEYVDKLHKFKPRYLYGYVSMILELAIFFDKNQYSLPSSVKSIITTSEVLSSHTREIIENTFGIKVFNEYGCGEVGSIAHECEHGNMHIMADNLILEIIDDSGMPAESGEIVVTDLFNYSMPLIRYKLGDFASLSKENCSCGRGLPLISNIHGRAYDLIRTSSGSLFHPEIVMYIFENIKVNYGGIEQFQFIQKTETKIDVIIVKSGDFHPKLEDLIRDKIQSEIDPLFELTFSYKRKIPREASGKQRVVKSELTGH